MRIAIASDHGAFALKELLVPWLRENHDVVDLGTHGPASVDYPDYGYRLAAAIAAGEAEYGVALCGSGIGISIAVNRNPACRCALVNEPLSAALAREHNDANVIALGDRQSAVEGKSVSVRVDHGGRRILMKKTTQIHKQQRY